MIEVIQKHWPMSVGDGKAARRKKPRILAVTTDCCTGCAGSPACIEYCPIEACMFWVPDEVREQALLTIEIVGKRVVEE